MFSNKIISRVQILIAQKNYKEAEKLLQELIKQDANNLFVHSLLSEVKYQQNDYNSALDIVNNAIGISPQYDRLFFQKSRILIQKNKYDEAIKNINQAIALDPQEAIYFAFLANIQLIRKQFSLALDTANKGLEIDAENIMALNVRSAALIKLDKKEASFKTIKGALREDPNNAYTHANYGWGLLEKGEHKKALEHFQESLKNDPSLEFAQSGMLQAIKAANPVYRLFLKYAFWMSNMTTKYQWSVILGFYFGFRILSKLAESNETAGKFIIPILILLAIFAFTTWVITPLSNLFLRFNTYGKLLLDNNQILSANFVALSLVVFIIGLVLYLSFADDRYLSLTVFGFAMMLPFSVMFNEGKYKHALIIYASCLAIIGIIAVLNTFATGVLTNIFAIIFFFAFIAFQWIANFLMIKQSNL